MSIQFYDLWFFWFGVVCTVLFVLLGVVVFAGFVMDSVWQKIKDGIALCELQAALRDYRTNKGKEGA